MKSEKKLVQLNRNMAAPSSNGIRGKPVSIPEKLSKKLYKEKEKPKKEKMGNPHKSSSEGRHENR